VNADVRYHMRCPAFLVLALAGSLLIVGCDVTVNSGGQRFTGADVTFVVPHQDSEATSGPMGIDYKSDAFNASTDGKELVVNGRSYGTLKPGDVVDFTDPGVVSVNGISRVANGT